MSIAAELSKLKHLNCFAHTLQLVLNDALGIFEIKPLLLEAKDLVRVFKSSNNETLRDEQ